jgi:hypothetical protein
MDDGFNALFLFTSQMDGHGVSLSFQFSALNRTGCGACCPWVRDMNVGFFPRGRIGPLF